MTKYLVEITETFKKIVIVEAETPPEAAEYAEFEWIKDHEIDEMEWEGITTNTVGKAKVGTDTETYMEL